jgi:EPS-associated MarR family transcriptional regulator
MQPEIHLKLLKLLEKNPQLTHRELAHQLGISLGKTNYCLKALKEKGWLKWGNFSKKPNKSQYMHLLTPKSISEKLILTLHLLKRKEKEYELLKEEIAHLYEELATSPLAANPFAQDVIERIEEAKHFVVRKHANEMDPNLIAKLIIACRN